MNMKEAYERAARLYALGKAGCILNETIAFHRCAGSHDLWFELEERSADGTVRKVPYRACASDGIVYPFSSGSRQSRAAAAPAGAVSISPDGRTGVRLDHYNLFLEIYSESGTAESTQLTEDGSEGKSYGILDPVDFRKYTQENYSPRRPVGTWSPDGRYFLTFCSLTEGIRHIPVTQHKPVGGGAPITFCDIQPYPGDKNIYRGVMVLCDTLVKKAGIICREDGAPQDLLFSAMLFLPRAVWGEDDHTVCFFTHDRYYKKWEARILDCHTGVSRKVVEEVYDTFGFLDGYDTATYAGSPDFSMGYSSDTREIVWRSELEGRSAFYLYDSDSGALKKRITDPAYSARTIKYIDYKNRMLYCTVSGEDEKIDPYLQRLYSFNMDSGEKKLLTPEIAEHTVTVGEGADLIADTYSLINTVPRTVLRDREGKIIREIAAADISQALEAGYIFPEPFQVTAADGWTKIYGILIRPAQFSPDQKYPLIDYIYGGSSHTNVPKAFTFSDSNITEPLSGLETLAQLGFACCIIDGLATPLREKAIHDKVYGRAWTCCGLEDHAAAIWQLSEMFPFIDADRVGIWGLSGGGCAAARAMLDYPETYKAAVSVCGNHDMRTYRADYVERWMGPYDEKRYSRLPNASRAANLKGSLLLIHGDMDPNVNVSETLEFAEALRAAGKKFSMAIIPNAPHTLAYFPEVIKMRWDFFVENLLGEKKPEGFSLSDQVSLEQR